MDWREHEEKSNPLIPYPIVHHLYATLREFMASLEKSPAVLARGKPMNPTGCKMKVAARKPPKKGGGRHYFLRRYHELRNAHPSNPTNPHPRGFA